MQRPARPVYTVAGNICQLVFIWIRDYIAIADDKDASLPNCIISVTTMKELLTVSMPSRVPMSCKAARSTSDAGVSMPLPCQPLLRQLPSGAEVQWMVQEETAALFQSHSSGFPFIRIGLRQIFQHPIFFRINHFSPIQIELIP